MSLVYMPTNSRFISMLYEYKHVLELSALYMKKRNIKNKRKWENRQKD